jgi:SanA protein
MKFNSKIIFLIIITLIIFGTGILVLCNNIISSKTKKYIYINTNAIPYNKVGLLLGTSKFNQSGQPNLYFYYRIRAAVVLYKAGKIKYIIVSGDNRTLSYNEPITMKKELLKNGIPSEVIFLDYAGFRTFDSIIRCFEIFGQKSFTIISQGFHLERAVFIAHRYGIGAIGYEARDVNYMQGLSTQTREYFARVKVFLDFFTGEKPKFLGKKIVIK